MNLKTIIVLSIGTCAMCVLMWMIMRHYKLAQYKCIPASVILTVTGTISTYIWYFIENMWFGGRSFYGAVFLVPVAFVYVAKFLHLPYNELMDCCAPAECVMLAIMKFQCLVDGCCRGKVLYISEEGIPVVFPSQITELVNAFVIMVLLMIMSRSKKFRGKIFCWYMIIYGITRFVLNLFREEAAVYIFGMIAGNVWSILAIIVGVMWLHDIKQREKQKR